MRAYSINPTLKEIKELDIDIQANTIFTFFNSILTDESTVLDKHTIFSDGNAISQNAQPFFIGEQLIVGDALILGKEGFLDIEATIPKDDLESLINYEVPPFYLDALALMQESNISLYKMFEASTDDETISLNCEWVLNVFNMADDKTKEYFLDELKKAVDAKKDMTTHMHKMASLALKAMTN